MGKSTINGHFPELSLPEGKLYSSPSDIMGYSWESQTCELGDPLRRLGSLREHGEQDTRNGYLGGWKKMTKRMLNLDICWKLTFSNPNVLPFLMPRGVLCAQSLS